MSNATGTRRCSTLLASLLSTLLASLLSTLLASLVSALRKNIYYASCPLPFLHLMVNELWVVEFAFIPHNRKYSFRRSSGLVSLTSCHVLCCTVCSQLLHCAALCRAFAKLSRSHVFRWSTSATLSPPAADQRLYQYSFAYCQACWPTWSTLLQASSYNHATTPHCRQEVAEPWLLESRAATPRHPKNR